MKFYAPFASFLLRKRQYVLNSPVSMREEMGKNEELIAQQQASKVMSNRGNARNASRRQVSAFWIILWFILALASVSLWMLRLLGLVSLGQL